MMTTKKYWLCLAMGVLAAAGATQSIAAPPPTTPAVTVLENNNPALQITEFKTNVVDADSSINVTYGSGLISELPASWNESTNTDSLLDAATRVSVIAKDALQSIPALQAGLYKFSQTGDRADLESSFLQINTLMMSIRTATAGAPDLRAKIEAPYNDAVNEEITTHQPNPALHGVSAYTYYFNGVAQAAGQLAKEAPADVASDSVNISATFVLARDPNHPRNESRDVLPLLNNIDPQQLDNLEGVAEQLNSSANPSQEFLQTQLAALKTALAGIEKTVEADVTSYQQKVTSIKGSSPPQDVLDALDKLSTDLNQLKSLTDDLTTELNGGSSAGTIISSAAKDVATLINSITDDKEDFDNLITALKDYVSSAQGAAKQAATDMSALVSQIQKDVAGAVSDLSAFSGISSLLSDLGLTGSALQTIATTVYKTTLADLTPVKHDLSTDNTQAGDKITLTITAAKSNAEPPTIDLNTYKMEAFLIGTHYRSTPVLMYAHDPSSGQFRFGAGDSILIKRGTRASVNANTLDSLGVGLNIAALDLNKDDQLELGLGGVVSCFDDLIQAGVGYDLQLNRTYYFIGLNMPSNK